ncbi:alpha/beta hydrolase [Gordonia terrae]|uniref:alpha/beta hydrolase n=1 Tax=Gordonia terrae TaxID=2055 RepID=UPI00200A3203|nr:alpha/beta hydrolase [Gordonia terrae]UPW08069.1 alpha/beta hydrolase [Gordonia terrae]
MDSALTGNLDSTPRSDTDALNPEIRQLLDLPAIAAREDMFRGSWDLASGAATAAKLRATPITGPAPPPVAEVVDTTIASTPVRVYRSAVDTTSPVAVFFHGGGWVFGDLDTQDYACRSLANSARCTVVSVDYDLAPEFPFPRPLEQSISVCKAIVAEAADLGVDPDRVALVGASSGGNLAAAVALDAVQDGWASLRAQALVYPPLDATTDSGSYATNASGFNLSAREMRFYWQMYHQGQTDPRDPRLSPLFAEDLSGLPPSLVFTAEYDVLRDDGRRYAARLEDSGVPTLYRNYDGQIHGFLGLGHIGVDAGHALREVGSWLRSTLAAD